MNSVDLTPDALLDVACLKRSEEAEKCGLAPHADSHEIKLPLVVDVDGTLIRTDLLIESAFSHLGRDPLRIIGVASALLRGKAALKAYIATTTDIDVTRLPYDEDVLDLIQEARAASRPVYLASASNERYVSAIAEYLGLFDGWFASSSSDNLASQAKADRLVATFGLKGFDYIGNDKTDLAVWKVAHSPVAVRASASVRARLAALTPNAIFIAPRATTGRWWKLLRVHQWAKNALVLVPVVTAQRFNIISLGEAIGAILAFCLAASSIYILNDLVDIEADRAHPSKKQRPLAAGSISVLDALRIIPILLILSLGGAVLIAPRLAAVLVAYLVLTTAYTFILKRKMMVDVVALATLYTLRVIGGAVAISVPVSEWLLAFSVFIFTALALVKRYVELTTLLDADLPDPTNRNYRKSDLDIVAALAAASAFNGITVFALYISSVTVHNLYRHPQVLWLICPILMYWVGRILILAHRRMMTDDPVVFALRDKNSLATACLVAAILLGAI